VREASVRLARGDRLVLYTDGVSEARNPAGEFYGEEGLMAALRRADPGLSARELTELLRGEIQAFSGGGELEDDMTLVVVRIPEFATRDLAPRHLDRDEEAQLIRTGNTTV
jgi:sigma-B regulation protein RsbU (phosphoserine phosphatase)